jgi:hypothetical protein
MQGHRVSEKGEVMYTPNWNAVPGHRDNADYIRAVTNAVYALPVSLLLL